ncbi:MAG: ABC transporter ATP-binding protein, partial [Eggerthellaceae bacterium]
MDARTVEVVASDGLTSVVKGQVKAGDEVVVGGGMGGAVDGMAWRATADGRGRRRRQRHGGVAPWPAWLKPSTCTASASASGYTHALRGVSLTVAQGEFLAIMGPSGSGKSTLMNLLGCLDTPTRGRYLLEGVDVADYRDDELAEIRATRLGFVFQSFNLLPRATVLRNVVLPLIYTACPRKERELRAHAALRSVSIDERLYDHRSNE